MTICPIVDGTVSIISSLVPYQRKKVLNGKIRKFLGTVFHDLASQREIKITDGPEFDTKMVGLMAVCTTLHPFK